MTVFFRNPHFMRALFLAFVIAAAESLFDSALLQRLPSSAVRCMERCPRCSEPLTNVTRAACQCQVVCQCGLVPQLGVRSCVALCQTRNLSGAQVVVLADAGAPELFENPARAFGDDCLDVCAASSPACDGVDPLGLGAHQTQLECLDAVDECTDPLSCAARHGCSCLPGLKCTDWCNRNMQQSFVPLVSASDDWSATLYELCRVVCDWHALCAPSSAAELCRRRCAFEFAAWPERVSACWGGCSADGLRRSVTCSNVCSSEQDAARAAACVRGCTLRGVQGQPVARAAATAWFQNSAQVDKSDSRATTVALVVSAALFFLVVGLALFWGCGSGQDILN